MRRRPESERSDWTEQDLLTREEASSRLEVEIVETEARLAQLGSADETERELLGTRLRALRETVADLARP
jgi:hypothetical protein